MSPLRTKQGVSSTGACGRLGEKRRTDAPPPLGGWLSGVASATLALLSACGGEFAPTAEGSPDSTNRVEQTVFNFTVRADREHFSAHGLAFEGAVGPYAIYRVTDVMPRLVGPSVVFNNSRGWAMLCGAASYFTADGTNQRVKMRLFNEEFSTDAMVDTDLQPAAFGNCADSSDAYGERVKRSGSPEGTAEQGVPSESPEATPEAGKGQVPQLIIDFEPQPDQGSTVLLRAAGLTDEKPPHNQANQVPDICCRGAECGLEQAPPAADGLE